MEHGNIRLVKEDWSYQDNFPCPSHVCWSRALLLLCQPANVAQDIPWVKYVESPPDVVHSNEGLTFAGRRRGRGRRGTSSAGPVLQCDCGVTLPTRDACFTLVRCAEKGTANATTKLTSQRVGRLLVCRMQCISQLHCNSQHCNNIAHVGHSLLCRRFIDFKLGPSLLEAYFPEDFVCCGFI